MVMGCYKGMVVAPAHACEDATNNGTHNWSKKKCVWCVKNLYKDKIILYT